MYPRGYYVASGITFVIGAFNRSRRCSVVNLTTEALNVVADVLTEAFNRVYDAAPKDILMEVLSPVMYELERRDRQAEFLCDMTLLYELTHE
jgi:hypothetical protein